MQMYDQFVEFPFFNCIVWVGNIMTPVVVVCAVALSTTHPKLFIFI